MSVELIVPIGIPASGKSTYMKKLSEEGGHIIHSSDKLRLELFGSYEVFDKNTELFQELYKRTKQDLIDGKSVIFDATNLSMKKRKHMLSLMPKYAIKKAVVFVAPISTCIERDSKRDRKVGSQVINRMWKSFQFPLYGEGFDEIKIMETDTFDKKRNYFNMMKIANNFDQNNPHHTLTVGEHMRRANIEYLYSKMHNEDKEVVDSWTSLVNFNISIALMLHDSGKLHTASFKNSKGEVTDICHYYGHENVSSYNSLLMNYFAKTQEELIYQAQLIQYHMLGNTALDTAKSKRKWFSLLGERLYNDIIEFNIWDKKGK